MIGNDYYKVDVNFELANDRLRSLVLFYGPLIGNDALALYEYLLINGTTAGFERLNELLNTLNIPVDAYEKQCEKLNEYRLLATLNKDDHYVFVLKEPLSMKQFIRDDILVRDFILKTSGARYQKIASGIFEDNRYHDFKDISKQLPLESLNEWDADDESYLKGRKKRTYDFNTRFDINRFLKDISTTMLPSRFRSEENMKEVALLADLYNISYDSMRTYIARTTNSSKDLFDLKGLKDLCLSAQSSYQKIGEDEYDMPSITYLMSLQDGKDVTRYDRQIIYNLAHDYNLNVPVINVLLKHTLDNCDNRLYEKYLYGIAADLHRNDIKTAEEAKKFLSRERKAGKVSADTLPKYDSSRNAILSKDEEEEILRLMGKE
ncbi:MAG: DnaD domain protein [Erysipelotrichaceae bacterium]|nr:DnaD domain protein [Erysipelotrichaceae bacterium]